MIRGFAEALSLDFVMTGKPAPGEDARAKELAKTKFSSAEWLYRR
jgi:hypothetical protein